MAILDLLNKLNARDPYHDHPLITGDLALKKSYLFALAVQALVDNELHDRERQHFMDVAAAFGIEQGAAGHILELAKDPGESDLVTLRRDLMQTKYKYYLIIDLVIMAYQDQDFQAIEEELINKFGEFFHIDEQEISFLTALARAVIFDDPQAKLKWVNSFFEKATIAGKAHPSDFTYYTK